MDNSATVLNGSLVTLFLRRVRDFLPSRARPTTTPTVSVKAWEEHLEQVRREERIKYLEADSQEARRPAPGTPKNPTKVLVEGQDDDGRDYGRDNHRRDPNDHAETLLRSLKAECEHLSKINKEIELTLKERNGLKRKRAELEEAIKEEKQGEEEEKHDPRKRARGAATADASLIARQLHGSTNGI